MSEESMTPIPIRVAAAALSIALGSAGCATSTISSTRMADGKEWTTENLNVNAPSYCYDDAEANCRRYGRCIRGTRHSGRASRSETVGGYRQMTNGGRWRSG